MGCKGVLKKVCSLSWKKWVFAISFCYMLVFAVIFGVLNKSTQMGLAILAGLLGMGFTRLDEIVEISGLGIKLRTRKLDKKFIELEALETRLAKQEAKLNKASDYMAYAFITAFRDIGVMHLKNKEYVFAADVVMMAVQIYAYNPKERSKGSVDAILSAMTGWLSEGTSTKEPLAAFLKEKEELILSDYGRLKKNEAHEEIIQKYERMMSKAGIDFKKDF